MKANQALTVFSQFVNTDSDDQEDVSETAENTKANYTMAGVNERTEEWGAGKMAILVFAILVPIICSIFVIICARRLWQKLNHPGVRREDSSEVTLHSSIAKHFTVEDMSSINTQTISPVQPPSSKSVEPLVELNASGVETLTSIPLPTSYANHSVNRSTPGITVAMCDAHLTVEIEETEELDLCSPDTNEQNQASVETSLSDVTPPISPAELSCHYLLTLSDLSMASSANNPPYSYGNQTCYQSGHHGYPTAKRLLSQITLLPMNKASKDSSSESKPQCNNIQDSTAKVASKDMDLQSRKASLPEPTIHREPINKSLSISELCL